MTKKNPFKNIETEVSLPEELKNDILQEVKEVLTENKDQDDTGNSKSFRA